MQNNLQSSCLLDAWNDIASNRVIHAQKHWMHDTPCGTAACLFGHAIIREARQLQLGRIIDEAISGKLYYFELTRAVSIKLGMDEIVNPGVFLMERYGIDYADSNALIAAVATLEDQCKILQRYYGDRVVVPGVIALPETKSVQAQPVRVGV